MWVRFLIILVSVSLIYQLSIKSKIPSRNLYVLLSKYRGYARFMNAQVKHETGNYNSRLSVVYNNLFGMGVPSLRKSFSSGVTPELFEGTLKSKFKDKGQSIRDFVSYLDFVNFPTDLVTMYDYVRELKARNYFSDSIDNYYKGMKKYL